MEGQVDLTQLLEIVCSKIGISYSKIGFNADRIREGRFVFARQASHPPLELPIKSGWAIESATTIDLS